MEAILFIGLPASGKSSFYKERFFGTHVRISRDLLKISKKQKKTAKKTKVKVVKKASKKTTAK